jgi:hypothetical protein
MSESFTTLFSAAFDDRRAPYNYQIRLATNKESLLTAARWHDVGKSLEAFQTMLRTAAEEKAPDSILAKSGTGSGSMPPRGNNSVMNLPPLSPGWHITMAKLTPTSSPM